MQVPRRAPRSLSLGLLDRNSPCPSMKPWRPMWCATLRSPASAVLSSRFHAIPPQVIQHLSHGVAAKHSLPEQCSPFCSVFSRDGFFLRSSMTPLRARASRCWLFLFSARSVRRMVRTVQSADWNRRLRANHEMEPTASLRTTPFSMRSTRSSAAPAPSRWRRLVLFSLGSRGFPCHTPLLLNSLNPRSQFGDSSTAPTSSAQPAQRELAFLTTSLSMCLHSPSTLWLQTGRLGGRSGMALS